MLLIWKLITSYFVNPTIRSVVEMIEAEIKETSNNLNLSSEERTFEQHIDLEADSTKKQEFDIVSVC